VDLGLKGRTALVLGASSGLGLASAEALRGEGTNVVMFARRDGLLRQEACESAP
jgi:3-oxoacyl-[acyl-carrier protein] reductase